MMDEHVKTYYAELVAQELNPPKPKPLEFNKINMSFGVKIVQPAGFGVIFTAATC